MASAFSCADSNLRSRAIKREPVAMAPVDSKRQALSPAFKPPPPPAAGQPGGLALPGVPTAAAAARCSPTAPAEPQGRHGGTQQTVHAVLQARPEPAAAAAEAAAAEAAAAAAVAAVAAAEQEEEQNDFLRMLTGRFEAT